MNGENIYEIRAKTWPAIQRAHNESRPTVLQIDTYRYYGHSVSDANAKKYRDPEEIDKYLKFHDPMRLWQKRLIEERILTAEQIAEIDATAGAEAAAAVRFAEESPLPEKSDIFSDVYFEVDHQTPAGCCGRHFFNEQMTYAQDHLP